MKEYISTINGASKLLMSSNPEQEEGFVSLVSENPFTLEEREKLQFTNELDANLKPIETPAYLDLKANEYKEKRRAEYPDWREFADAYVKGDEIAMQEYKDACLAVKEKYPKPM